MVQYKKIWMGVLFICVVMITIFSYGHYSFDSTLQLAQISAIKTKILKEWQQSHGLQNHLAYNSSGYEVTLLQHILSQDHEIYPQSKITGYYGNLTQDAVLRFQKEYALPQTGIVDLATRNQINKILFSHLCPEQDTVYPDLFFIKITRQRGVPIDYVPSSLENISDKVKTIGIVCVRKEIIDPLVTMFKDAEKDGIYFAVTSGYRKSDIQKYLLDFWIGIEGEAVRNEVANPGKSEHQLGTAIDLTDASIGYAGVSDRFADSVGYKWLQENAHTYGFVLSYPKGKENITTYNYEPWHWRYVGADVAREVHTGDHTYNEVSIDRSAPFPKENIQNGLAVSAQSIVSIYFDLDDEGIILLEKNKEKVAPIASITKLMTALVAVEMLNTNSLITIRESSLRIKGLSNMYMEGDTFLLKDALGALLISSHNEIADAIADTIGKEKFISRMNKKADELGLTDTHFINVTGLDPEKEDLNVSTASDVSRLLKYIFEEKPDIFSYLEKEAHDITERSTGRKIIVRTTNNLITDKRTKLRIFGGKTGETPKAGMNLAIVSKAPEGGYILSVVIGSQDSFRDVEKILEYITTSFKWN